MNLDSLTLTLSQISYLVINLTKKNYSSSVQEINELVREYGFEADRYYLCKLFSFYEVGLTSKESPQLQLLCDEVASLLSKPALESSICFAFDQLLSLKGSRTPQLLSQLLKALKLPPVQEVIFGISLLISDNTDTVSQATQFLKIKLPELIRSYINSDTNTTATEGGLHDTTPEILHTVLFQVLSESSEQLGVTNEIKEAFLHNLRKDFPKDLVPIILSPLLYPESELCMEKLLTELENMSHNMVDSNIDDLVGELGFSLTSNVDKCRGHLGQLVGRDLKVSDIARLLIIMVKSRAVEFWLETDGAKDKDSSPWNVENLVQACKELNPKINWGDVLLDLDQADFVVKDRHGLNVIISAIKIGMQSHSVFPDRFPVEHLYRHWKHTDAQMSLLQQIMKNPDILCFSDYPFHPVIVDILKAPPESENKEIASWRSSDLIEILLYLGERGHYQEVQELLKIPAQHSPDVLILGILQGIHSSVISLTPFRHEILANLMPTFLGNHPNSAIILHHAWHMQNVSVKQIIMHSMGEWYLRGGDNDQSRLSRILDVAQDLKALSLLLNAQSFPFVIDLACLASRRGYLKLEKWLTDKIREHDEPFITAVLKFLQKRVPHIGGLVKEDTIPKAAQLPHETLSTILLCLQACAGNVSEDVGEAIHNIITACGLVVNKARQAPPGVLRAHRGLDSFPPSSLFSSQVDSLNTAITGISLATSSSAFTLPAGLGQLVSNPGSPSRLMAASQSPAFPIMPLGAPAPSIVPQVGLQAAMAARLQLTTQQQQPIEKGRIFPKDIEDEANSYFQRIYNHPPHPTISIDEVLDMLKKFMDSPKQRERDVFYCMLRNLFEEYKFFPQYPEKELFITAQLFGGIIERGLVSDYRELGMALRYVLDALRKPLESKMFYFGIAALDRFKSRLKDYHKYCEHIASIPHFSQFPQHLVEYVEFGLESEEPPGRPQGPIVPGGLTAVTTAYKTNTQTTGTTTSTPTPTTTTTPMAKSNPTSVISSRPSIANATNIDTLLVATEKEEKMTSPPEQLQDKVAFIFNNLSQLNLQTKCDELRDLVCEEYYAWMAQYLVMKRASIELNFHALYSNFLDVLKTNDLNRLVLQETFRNIRVLLRSDKGIANFSDRSLLKNLGHWLGMLTLGRNKPILHDDLDLKSLIVEAYNKGQQELLYVVPFVAKVLESCSKSRVFKPPNPWTMAIMSVLAELHQEPDLKLNLKFEIEVLCKNLSLDVAEIQPKVYLKDPDNVKHLEHQLSPPKQKETQSTTPLPPSHTPAQQPHPVVEEIAPRITNNTPTLVAALSPPEPRFSYMQINVSSIANIAQHITINSQLPLLQTHPKLKQYIFPAVEGAIQEWIHPVVDRAVKIAVTTSEQIIKKDFALEPEENRMRLAAHHMVRNLTAGMAMITCRDQLLVSMSNNLKNHFLRAFPNANEQQKSLVEHAATIIAQENMELACCFIQKTAMEKAVPEMDKHLLPEYERRKNARTEGRRYCDPNVLTYQAERMPEQLRLKVGGVTAQQTAVYEELARNIPGFQPISERDAAIFIPKPVESMAVVSSFQNSSAAPLQYSAHDEFDSIFEKLYTELEHYVQTMLGTQCLPQIPNLLELLVILRRDREDICALRLVQKTVECLMELTASSLDPEIMLRHRDLYLRILKTFQDQRAFGVQWTNKQVTMALLDLRDDLKYNIECIDILIRSQLVNFPQFDIQLALAIENSQNFQAVNFAMQLIQLYVLDERNPVITENDLLNTVEVLARLAAHSRQHPEGLNSLIEMLRASQEPSLLMERTTSHSSPAAHILSGIAQGKAREYDDPPGLAEKTEYLLREWVEIYHSPQGAKDPNKAFSVFVHQMNIHGILKTDDLITRFFRMSTQMVVELCYRLIPEVTGTTATAVRNKMFHTVDAYVKLISLLVKHSGDANNSQTKINLLNKVLGIVAGVLQQDHETHQTEFQQLPYQRIFIMLFLELNNNEPLLEAINFQVLTAYFHTLHILRPSKSPGFSYAWLELVSHRIFLGKMLGHTPQQKGWVMYAQLLVDLFKYLAPFLRNAELAKPVTVLYKGTLRVLLVLLHDFPEFLCDYHYGFCDAIPPNCIQMRNLILSAFPRNMRLPDPFTPNLKVDMLSEISNAPRVLTEFTLMIQTAFKKELDTYLKARAPVTFLSDLRSNLQVSNEPGLRYNIQLMNALVLYVGTEAIAYIRKKGLAPNMSTIAHSAHMDIFQNLAVDLDTEGRYLFLNAIANQLRYPNSHTHYFSCTLLYLFAEANTEAIQEQITRVLLERLIVNRPHPWGLLITFIELIKNPTYKFWNHEFVHCAPEIEKLFESVARSCMVQKQQPAAENDLSELPNMNTQATLSVA